METITVSIPSDWVQGTGLDLDGLRQVIKLGLRQWRQQQPQGVNARVIQTLLSTGRVRHLTNPLIEGVALVDDRQPSPTLPGMPVSEIIVAQRHGEP